MVKDRHSDFLAWLVGPSKTVVFDEAHLGTVERSGVSGLMRKYRLYWFVTGLIALAGLFIWKIPRASRRDMWNKSAKILSPARKLPPVSSIFSVATFRKHAARRLFC